MSKLKALWSVLRGRPTCYRMHFDGGVAVKTNNRETLVISCTFTGNYPYSDGIVWTGGTCS